MKKFFLIIIVLVFSNIILGQTKADINTFYYTEKNNKIIEHSYDHEKIKVFPLKRKTSFPLRLSSYGIKDVKKLKDKKILIKEIPSYHMAYPFSWKTENGSIKIFLEFSEKDQLFILSEEKKDAKITYNWWRLLLIFVITNLVVVKSTLMLTKEIPFKKEKGIKRLMSYMLYMSQGILVFSMALFFSYEIIFKGTIDKSEIFKHAFFEHEFFWLNLLLTLIITTSVIIRRSRKKSNEKNKNN